MIKKTVQDDVFNSEAKHIAFAINADGVNDSGFAGRVASEYWPELRNCGENAIGTVLCKTVGDKTFHAMVCYSLDDGWLDNQTQVIKKCFDRIHTNGEAIAAVAIGTDFIERINGANFGKIICGMVESQNDIILYSSYSYDGVMEIYHNEAPCASGEESGKSYIKSNH